MSPSRYLPFAHEHKAKIRSKFAMAIAEIDLMTGSWVWTFFGIARV
jgi:hypothetical protein